MAGPDGAQVKTGSQTYTSLLAALRRFGDHHGNACIGPLRRDGAAVARVSVARPPAMPRLVVCGRRVPAVTTGAPDVGPSLLGPAVTGVRALADARRQMASMSATQLLAIARGERPPRLINPQVWPEYAGRFARIFGIPPAGHSAQP